MHVTSMCQDTENCVTSQNHLELELEIIVIWDMFGKLYVVGLELSRPRIPGMAGRVQYFTDYNFGII